MMYEYYQQQLQQRQGAPLHNNNNKNAASLSDDESVSDYSPEPMCTEAYHAAAAEFYQQQMMASYQNGSPTAALYATPSGTYGIYQQMPTAASPKEPIPCKRGKRPDLHSPSKSDPGKDILKRTIQRKLRLKMLRKGQLPPNPTVEELQLCGIQAIPITPYSMQMPCYYVQSPYDGSPQAVPYLPSYGLYPQMADSPSGKPLVTSTQSKPRSVAEPEQQNGASQTADHDSATSSQMSMSPIAVQLPSPHHHQHHLAQAYYDYKYAGLYQDDDGLQRTESLSTGSESMEPFLLPERNEAASQPNFDSFFILQQHQESS